MNTTLSSSTFHSPSLLDREKAMKILTSLASHLAPRKPVTTGNQK